MRVSELIEALSKCDQDAFVVVNALSDSYDYEGYIGLSAEYVVPNVPTDPHANWHFNYSPVYQGQAVIVIG